MSNKKPPLSSLADLWKYALELRIAKDTILYCDTCFTAQVDKHKTNNHYFLPKIINLWCIGPSENDKEIDINQALVKLFLDLQEKHCRGQIQASVRPADVVHTIQVIYYTQDKNISFYQLLFFSSCSWLTFPQVLASSRLLLCTKGSRRAGTRSLEWQLY